MGRGSSQAFRLQRYPFPASAGRLALVSLPLVLLPLGIVDCRNHDDLPATGTQESPATVFSVSSGSYVGTCSLLELKSLMDALQGRDDLDALDRLRALDLAWRNRSPAQVSDRQLSCVAPDDRESELELRQAWRQDHVAYSWDNLDPEAQLEPRPQALSLTWLTLALQLPRARNGHSFQDDRITDYFMRKAWYVPRKGDLRLSWMDRVQMENARKELKSLDADTLRAHLASLPRDGMSPEEAEYEERLAQALLDEQVAGGGP